VDDIPSFSGYAGMAYLPACKLAIAISVTVDETADPDRNYSVDVLKDLAAKLVPEAHSDHPGRKASKPRRSSIPLGS